MSLFSFIRKSKKEKRYLFRRKFFPNSITNQIFIDFLHTKGINVGEGTYFFDPSNTTVDVQRPWGLTIGEYCKITSGVVILAHDYSRSVLRRKYNDILCEFKKTIIGNNVFIGMNSILLMGTEIGNNCIIGAGSVVSGFFPDNVVIAGNPARIICTLDEYYQKRKNAQIEEAKNWVKCFYEKYKRAPLPNELSAFFVLFLKRDVKELENNKIWYKWNGDNEKEILDSFLNSQPQFSNYDEFINISLSETNEKELK